MAHNELERIRTSAGLTAKNVVDSSRDEDAPLHNYFEWNDEAAAESYREQQARQLIRAVFEVKDTQEAPIYYHVSETGGQYEHIDVIIKKPNLTDLAIAEVQATLDSAAKSAIELQTYLAGSKKAKALVAAIERAQRIAGRL